LAHSYRIVVNDDGGRGQSIEFEGLGAEAALIVAQRACSGRQGELFEDGRSLGRLHLHPEGGYWIISPPEGARASS